MRIQKNYVVICLLLLVGLVQAAPLFPDLPEEHWARDTVASLAARGLVEGYPDGTFKGDRAASRWELALVVARLLSDAENSHRKFSHQSELQDLRQLASELSSELDALGVCIDALGRRTSALEQRVGELERITFYGSLDTRVVMQSFHNDGVSDNDSLRGGSGLPGSVPYLNYDTLVGSAAGPPLRPQLVGVFPTVDYRVGKALTNGTGLTSLAILGLNIKAAEDIDAGLELAAFSSQGDQFVDAYWGVSAPYTSNIFTANVPSGQSLSNTPYTRMTLKNFWMHHKPSDTRVVIGQIDKTDMEPLVYAGQGNLGVFGPVRWPGFGFDVSGESATGSQGKLHWEVLGTRLGNGVRFHDDNYQSYALNGNLGFDRGRFGAQVDFSRVIEEAGPTGQPLAVGFHNGMNMGYGASTGWSIRQWVNPPGYFAGQLNPSVVAQLVSIPNSADTRPIVGWNAVSDNAIGFGAGAGNYGPSSQDTYGLGGHYDFPLRGRNTLRASGKFARSDFRPNRNSAYSSSGNALAFDLDAALLEGALDLSLGYIRIDPNYSPAAWFGNALGGRPVKSFNFTGVGHLYNNGKYPHNREGFRFKGSWKFDHDNGKIWTEASRLRQTETSLYDVRVIGGALGPSLPTNDVIGFAPGFVDPIFSGYAHPNIYGSGSGNSFTSTLQPLEDHRGYNDFAEVGASYRWDEVGFELQGAASRNSMRRRSDLSPALGGSQNKVDVDVDCICVSCRYDISAKLTVDGGVDQIWAKGHYDPGGLYNNYAVLTGETDFQNVDSGQFIPHLGLDYSLTDSTSVDLLGRYYKTSDGVDQRIQPGNSAQVGSSAHPFDWSGWQLSSEFKMAF